MKKQIFKAIKSICDYSSSNIISLMEHSIIECIETLEYVMKIYPDKNSQWFLNVEDRINKLSVTDWTQACRIP